MNQNYDKILVDTGSNPNRKRALKALDTLFFTSPRAHRRKLYTVSLTRVWASRTIANLK